MSRITLPSGPQIVCLYGHHEVTMWRGSRVWHDLNCESIFLLSGLESSPCGAECCLVLNVSSQRPSSLSLETIPNKSVSPLLFHLPFHSLLMFWGTGSIHPHVGGLHLPDICCLLSSSPKSPLGPRSVCLVSLISPHKSVPPFPSSFLLLFSERSPVCLQYFSCQVSTYNFAGLKAEIGGGNSPIKLPPCIFTGGLGYSSKYHWPFYPIHA